MNRYVKFIAEHPYIILLVTVAFSTGCAVINVLYGQIPSFTDPQMGFETRGTELSNRLTTWTNLEQATKPSGVLSVNPGGDFENVKKSTIDLPSSTASILPTTKKLWEDNIEYGIGRLSRYKDSNVSRKLGSEEILKAMLIEEESQQFDEHDSHEDHKHVSNDGFFCEGLSASYSHLVFIAKTLLTYTSIQSLCHLQNELMISPKMSDICQTISKKNCCPPWSLPNYIGLLRNRSSCYEITEEDVDSVTIDLKFCVNYFQSEKCMLHADLCDEIPMHCRPLSLIFYYIVDGRFSNLSTSFNMSMVFLPIARSSAVLPYFRDLPLDKLSDDFVQLAAVDFGVKNAYFDALVVEDSFYMIIGGVLVLICTWIYTGSLFVTLAAVMSILMSLMLAYTIYTFVFRIDFFPFMNLLAVVLALGIGADDVFVYCKIWRTTRKERSNTCTQTILDATFGHAAVSMFVTSATTASALYASAISQITAIACFSLFAGTAVMVNFLFMITLLPASVVISEKFSAPNILPLKWRPAINLRKRGWSAFKERCYALMEKYIFIAILRFHWVWLITYTGMIILSVYVIFYNPSLQLPDSRNFQLFQSSNLFEQYDLHFRNKFNFERLGKGDVWDSDEVAMPLRFVWGVLPRDNGDYFNPASKGSLEFDKFFDISSPLSQSWLLNFCQNIRQQHFYQPTMGPMLSNCFVESFRNWMQRRCKNPIDNSDRSPCCESSKFPYRRRVFDLCIVKAISSLHKTPGTLFQPGMAGPKFARGRRGEIKAIVIEYESNHTYTNAYSSMHHFFTDVDTWFKNELKSAPMGLRNGWFVSELHFYDLQKTLQSGTYLAFALAISTTLLVIFVSTLNILVTLFASITVAAIIFVTVSHLILLGWKLNILESVAFTTAIGMSVDFCLHYAVAYYQSGESSRAASTTFAFKRMIGPTFMAALTTFVVGHCIYRSTVLPYIQIGQFMQVMMLVAWLYSSFYLLSLLAVAGPSKDFGQFRWPPPRSCLAAPPPNGSPSRTHNNRSHSYQPHQHHHQRTGCSESTLSTSSGPVTEMHELEVLAGLRK